MWLQGAYHVCEKDEMFEQGPPFFLSTSKCSMLDDLDHWGMDGLGELFMATLIKIFVKIVAELCIHIFLIYIVNYLLIL